MRQSIKGILLGVATVASAELSFACTGISLTAKDGSYVQARTIEWAYSGMLKSEYVIIPRGERLRSFTPDGADGMRYTARYGVVGLAVQQREFIAEGINEAGLSAGLFFFPNFGSYEPFDAAFKERSVCDMQLVEWMLSQCATIDDVKQAIEEVRVIPLINSVALHWRIGEPTGRQVVLEIVDGEAHFYENRVGVLTNAPDFQWHLTNLDNYVNLRPGAAEKYQLGGTTLSPLGGSSAMLGLPGDFTPPSRFIRAAFFCNTAAPMGDGEATVMQAFHLLNSFDVPMTIENPNNRTMCSATQWTSAIDLSHRKVYYHTAINMNVRCIDLSTIDFTKVKYQSHPLDSVEKQPVEQIVIQ